MSARADHAREIRYAIVDVRVLCERLGLLAGRGSFVRQARGLIIRCPWHDEKTPSCSVRVAEGGTIGVRCHGCGATGDALSLVAQARGLSVKRDFLQVLRDAAEIAGLWHIVQDLEHGSGRRDEARPAPAPVPPPIPEPPRDYPPADEVDALWASCTTLAEDLDAVRWATSRGLDPDAIDGRELARVLPKSARAPRWARYQGRSWTETGHRLIVPMRSASGAFTSVRAGRIVDGDTPKRLPPGGHKASGLVMADTFGIAMLTGGRAPGLVVIVEGEPDFLTRASITNDPKAAVLGIVSGSWSVAFALRIPRAASVVIRTDHDAAGDRYAAEIAATLKHCFVKRARAESRPSDGRAA